MTLSEGQLRSLDQLRRIESTPNSAIRIDYIQEPINEDSALVVDLSVNCQSYEYVYGGLKLNPRESIQVYIPRSFPYELPSVLVSHTRFDGFPHVQWKRFLCLYQAPDSEWHPEDGMYGFMRRVHAWLKDASLNQLNADGAPLHPPAVYTATKTLICVNADTPNFDTDTWIGGATLDRITENRLDLVNWVSFQELSENENAIPAFLLSTPFSFEYPTNVRELVRQLESSGISTTIMILLLAKVALNWEEDKPLYVAIGTPMRGVGGKDGERKQHISIWEIDAIAIKSLQLIEKALDLCSKWRDHDGKKEINTLTDEIIQNFYKWMDYSKVGWCRIMENRPEVTVRRDLNTNMSIFKNMRVIILGCGAIGGQVAEHLVRAGVSHITLVDKNCVNPGILVRQNFERDDISFLKSEALEKRLKRINSEVEIDAKNINILKATEDMKVWLSQFDVVFDLTASLQIRTRLEEICCGLEKKAVLASMMVSARAEFAALAIAGPNYSGATLDILRRLGLSAMNRGNLEVYKKAFWSPEFGKGTFQPEPGCSAPTFVGSSADISSLSAKMLNKCGSILKEGSSNNAEGCLFANDNINIRDYRFTYESDIQIKTENGLDIRVSKHVWRDMSAWIKAGARDRGGEIETGGLLFGELNEASKTLWISEVIGPPSDSEFSQTEFTCGTCDTVKLNEEKRNRTQGVVQYIGTWHSHPVSSGIPSEKDWEAIGKIFAANLTQAPIQIMMIVGQASKEPEIGAYVFERSSIEQANLDHLFSINVDGGLIKAPSIKKYGKKIGLALSGGGSRAIAHHLGCLRALNDLNLLDDVEVISGVSGGAVITALLGYDHGPFENVDNKTVSFLKKGLVRPSIERLILKFRFLPILFTLIFSTLPAVVLGAIRYVACKVYIIAGVDATKIKWLNYIRWPFRRWYSRTHVMAETLVNVVGGDKLNKPTRDGKNIVLNACELATGTAFRMSNKEFGSWRFGKGNSEELKLADAVAASAAFPPALPAFDWKLNLENLWTKEKKYERVIVTDGGIFENLAVSCLEPGRSTQYSIVSYNPDIIISCDAGAGQFKGDITANIWPQRMMQSFDSLFRKVQDSTKSRLYSYEEQGKISAFVYSHLGQIDSKVLVKPSVWVAREKVMDYPTNFSAMKESDISTLSSRGESITRALITRYLLSE